MTAARSDRSLKLLFMDRRDVYNTWGQLRFGAEPLEKVADAPKLDFNVHCCLRRQDGSYDVWGAQYGRNVPWKLVRCRTRDGIHVEDVRVLLERKEEWWSYNGSITYSPDLRRFIVLRNASIKGGDGFRMYVFHSSDGETWKECERNPVFFEGDNWDTMWSSAVQKFIWFGKGIQRYPKRIPELFANARRVVTVRTSPDGCVWTPDDPSYYKRGMKVLLRPGDPRPFMSGWRQVEGQLVPVEHQLAPDDEDPPDLEFYAGRAFPYEGRYFLRMANYAPSWIPPGIPPVRGDGHGPHLDTELWISRNGLDWERPFRAIHNGAGYNFHEPMAIGGKLLFRGADAVYGLGEDRITYVTSRANSVFDTVLFRSEGRPFRLNARLPGKGYPKSPFLGQNQAYVMAELVDELDKVFPGYDREQCIIQGEPDAPDIPLRWKGRDGSELAGKRMRLRFYFRAADIFAVTT